MALPHELPVTRPDTNDPAYQRFVWARFLAQEANYATVGKRTAILLTVEAAREIATLLDPDHHAPPRKAKR
jgi:hypothetical protein